jgi:hypothetical protein
MYLRAGKAQDGVAVGYQSAVALLVALRLLFCLFVEVVTIRFNGKF